MTTGATQSSAIRRRLNAIGARLWAVRRRPGTLLLAVLAIVYTVSCFQGLGEYFLVGHEGFAGAQRSTIARNYLRYGFIKTGLKPVIEAGPATDISSAAVHWHHPPGANVLVGLSFAVFGQTEAAARLVPVLATIGTLFLLFSVVRRRHGRAAAIGTAVVFALLPMRVYYGNLINYEVPVIFLGLSSIWALERLRSLPPGRASRVQHALVFAALLAAGFVDWPGFILAAMIGTDALLRRPRRPWVFVGVAASSAALALFLYHWLGSSRGAQLESLAQIRSAGHSMAIFRQLAQRTAERAIDYFTLVPLLAGAMWVGVEAGRLRVDPVVSAFTLMTLVYFAAFPEAASVHVFYLYYATPAVAVAAGGGIARLLCALGRGERVGAAAALLALAALTLWPRLEEAHARTYGILPPAQPARGFPRDGQLDVVLLGKLVHQLSRPGDNVAFGPGIPDTPQLTYYVDRRTAHVSSSRSATGAQWLVVSERSLMNSEQQGLAEQYPVTQALGYLIYDLSHSGPKVHSYAFRVQPSTLWWWFAVSAFYPPHELVEDRQAGERYARRMQHRTRPSGE